MCLIIEPSVLEMISVNISLSLEESITDDNIRKKKTGWRTSKTSVHKMFVGCTSEMALFKVRSGRDILIETVFNVEY